jgi:hypothetical protein
VNREADDEKERYSEINQALNAFIVGTDDPVSIFFRHGLARGVF